MAESRSFQVFHASLYVVAKLAVEILLRPAASPQEKVGELSHDLILHPLKMSWTASFSRFLEGGMVPGLTLPQASMYLARAQPTCQAF
jgi:hypothetical protein